jgi:hypothetical protein
MKLRRHGGGERATSRSQSAGVGSEVEVAVGSQAKRSAVRACVRAYDDT